MATYEVEEVDGVNAVWLAFWVSTLITDMLLPKQVVAYTAPPKTVAPTRLPTPVANVLEAAAERDTEVIRQVPAHEVLAPELKYT